MSIRPEEKILCVDHEGRLRVVVAFSISPYREGTSRDRRHPRQERIYGFEGLPYGGLEPVEDGQAFRIPETDRLLRRVARERRPQD